MQTVSPQVNSTGENGAVTSVNPTTNDYYDLSGRLIGVRDANGNLTTRKLLAGSGYGGAAAVVTNEYHPDGGAPTWGYDVFGNQILYTNEVGQTQTNAYDAMGRLTSVTYPARAANTPGNTSGSPVALVDYYAYDGLGERIKSWNSQLGTGATQTTAYDVEGRVTREVDAAGYATAYSYSWNSAIATAGLGTFGGWTKTTTNSSNLTEIENIDAFGREAGTKTDFGANTYTYAYDKAGRLVSQGDETNLAGGQSLTYAYYNTNQLAQITDVTYSGTTTGMNGSGQQQTFPESDTTVSSFGYDVDGDRLTESQVDTVVGVTIVNPADGLYITLPTSSATSYENAVSTYDALDRLVSLTDAGDAAAGNAAITINYEYDAGSNIRHMVSTYQDQVTANQQDTQDYWYRYDSMNRFVTTMGQLSGSRGAAGTTIVRGYQGKDITYDAAGERATTSTTSETPYGYIQFYYEGTPIWAPGDDVHTEFYGYTEDGYLSTVKIADNIMAVGAGTGQSTGTQILRVVNTRDALGRVIGYTEYNPALSASTAAYSRTGISYDADSHLLADVTSVLQSDGATVLVTASTYSYTSGGVYQGGALTDTASTTWKNSVNGVWQSATDNATSYIWRDTALQSAITYKPNSSTTYTTSFGYGVDGRLSAAWINDGRPRTITYIDNALGQVIDRTDSTGPIDHTYIFNGVERGEINNNGAAINGQTDYATVIANRDAAAQTGAFTNGSAKNVANFDQSYDAISPSDPGQTGSTYTVNAGDTLQSIASAVWGDSSLWYLIADANGLNGTETLVQGTTLSIPGKVTDVHHTSSTFEVYDPNKAIGNVEPTTPAPPPPAKHHSSACGVIGQIITAIVAIVANIFLGPILGDAVTQGFKILTHQQNSFNWNELGMTVVQVGVDLGVQALEAVGLPDIPVLTQVAENTAAQGIDLAVGLEKKFDWVSVATSAVEGAVGYGVNQGLGQAGIPTNGWVGDTLRGTAQLLAGAGARSLITRQDFGTSIDAELPGVLASTLVGGISGALNRPQAAPAPTAAAPLQLDDPSTFTPDFAPTAAAPQIQASDLDPSLSPGAVQGYLNGITWDGSGDAGNRFFDSNGDEIIMPAGSSSNSDLSPGAQANRDALLRGYNNTDRGDNGNIQIAEGKTPYLKVGVTAPPVTAGVAVPADGAGDVYVYAGAGAKPGLDVSVERKEGISGVQVSPTTATVGYDLNQAIENVKARIYNALVSPINDAYAHVGLPAPYPYKVPDDVDGINKN